MQFIVIFELLVGTPAEHLNIHVYKHKLRQYACKAQDVGIFHLKVWFTVADFKPSILSPLISVRGRLFEVRVL